MAEPLRATVSLKITLGACVAAVLSACAVGPNFHTPAAPQDSTYGKAQQAMPATIGAAKLVPTSIVV